MKFNKFIYASMAAALLASCSDKDVIADAPDGGTSSVPTNGDGYVAVNINLPTTPVAAAPRAANDEFNDGTLNEYKVKDAALLLFHGSSESAATFASAYTLTIPRWFDDEETDPDHITTSALVAVKVTNPAQTGENLYGLVVLNYKNVATIDGTAIKFGDKTFTGTFSEFAAKTSNADFYNGSGKDAEYFFMANAPLSAVNDATKPVIGNITTLVDITNGIKPTKLEAENAPAGEFFVERAVAKATLSNTATDYKGGEIVNPDGSTTLTLTPGKVEWTLNATNTQSFVVRNMYKTGSQVDFIGCKSGYRTTYRMVGNTNLADNPPIQGSANPARYRTYWCFDPNYNTQTVGLTYKDNTVADFIDAGDTPLYCYENTFDIANQLHQNTTQAIVKVQFKLGGEVKTFYTLDGQQNILYMNDDVKSYFVKYILNDPDFKTALENAVKDTGKTVEITTDNYETYLDITWGADAKGRYDIETLAFKPAPFEALNADIAEDAPKVTVPVMPAGLMNDANAAHDFAEYKDGVSYYPVRFKHFAGQFTTADCITDKKDLAPWEAAKVGASAYDFEGYTGTKTGATDASDMWLGRYGMVRNNWYDVQVTALKKLGAPTVADLKVDSDNTTDDQVEQWIAFKVSILSWAMRKQQIEL